MASGVLEIRKKIYIVVSEQIMVFNLVEQTCRRQLNDPANSPD